MRPRVAPVARLLLAVGLLLAQSARAERRVVLLGFTGARGLEAHAALSSALGATYAVTPQQEAAAQAASAGLSTAASSRTPGPWPAPRRRQPGLRGRIAPRQDGDSPCTTAATGSW